MDTMLWTSARSGPLLCSLIFSSKWFWLKLWFVDGMFGLLINFLACNDPFVVGMPQESDIEAAAAAASAAADMAE
jgi:hypothetical protein